MDTKDQALLITPYLTAYFNQQDRAKKLTTSGFMARELASYQVRETVKAQKEIVTEAVKVGTLKEIRKQIKKILKKAKTLQGEELRKVGARIEALYQQAEKINGSTH